MMRRILRGAAAGAAGTTALHAVTYADMALRGRPPSRTPEESVEKIARMLGADLPGDAGARENRLQGLGALAGMATGVLVGAAYGAVEGLVRRQQPALRGVLVGTAALVGANAPMAVLGISDPRSWSAADWVSDLVPHVAYGLVTALTYDAASS